MHRPAAAEAECPAVRAASFSCSCLLSPRNKDTEILVNYETRETITLNELMPKWWGDERYAEQMSNSESET